MTCPSPEVLATWVDGELSLNQAHELERHVPSCSGCREEEQRLKTLRRWVSASAELPKDDGFVADVAQRLAAVDARTDWGWRALILVAVSFVALVGVDVAHRLGKADGLPADAPVPRGGAGAAHLEGERRLGFEAFRENRGEAPVALHPEDVLRAGDGLSFVVYNRSHLDQELMLFGVDAQGDVHWFYPEFRAAGTDPASVHLSARPEEVPLPEGVTPESLAAGRLRVVALFSPKPLHVRRVEAALFERDLSTLKAAFPDATVQVLNLQVAP